ncbi:flagellar hook-length control protein FliK [Stenotrophomonas sp. NLF4-10]|uniref:flagellar hook-length control protein FliK n=1 Tax=Stenotrophomonas sp. NLF4-10 TaxID=2918754 RepID=UPI001EFB0456|nr:flagellar hook-length control protein FliK [Stenotrophomonas sp. NLF4-10]MCG8276520.1 flagellar hook-length control protein FliK [Stenotrophomonas sp. NLF4-10]
MNGLSFPVAPAPASTASTAQATGNGGDKAGGDAFKHLLDGAGSPAKASGKETAGKPRPAPGRASDAADDTAATEETTGKPTDTATRGDADAAANDDTQGEAPWPPPGLPMLAPADPAPAPGADTQLAVIPAVPTATNPAPPPAAETATLAATAPPLPTPTATTATLQAAPIAKVAAPPLGTTTAAATLPALPINEEAAPAPVAEALASLAGDTAVANADSDAAPTPLPNFGHLLQGATPAPVRVEATPFTGELAKPVAVHTPDFDEAIGARIGWLAEQKIGHAHIRVTPNDLGPVEVRLQLEGDRVHASFTSAHADVRHALENSLPKLREMLGEQGMQLAHADVGQHSDPRANGGDGQAGAGGGDAETGAPGTELPAITAHGIRLRGLLDAYA